MALYLMADTHLSVGGNKPMDVFGNRWSGYTEKIKNNWNALVRPDDTVVLPGDISWAMHLADAKPDFDFLESLPGEKIISKGNHDFWWETTAKLERFCRDNNYTSFHFLHNNAYLRQGYIICGSRGWYTEDKKVTARNDTDAQKIIAREVGRLRTSLAAGKALQTGENADVPIIVCLHFPPYFKDYACNALIDAMEEYGVKMFDNDLLKVTYIAATTATSIDSAKLKKKYPAIAEECSKTSAKSAYVKVEIKE